MYYPWFQQRTGYPIRADFSDITQDNLQEMVQAVFLIAFVHASVIQKTAYPLCQCLFKEEYICLPHFFCEGLHVLFAEDNCADAALFGAVFLVFRYGLSALDEYFFPGMVVQQFSDKASSFLFYMAYCCAWEVQGVEKSGQECRIFHCCYFSPLLLHCFLMNL